MKKQGWGIVVVLIAGVVVAGYLLSQAVIAGPQEFAEKANSGPQQSIGTVLTEFIEPEAIALAAGIKNTINIPPAAFVSVGDGVGYTIIPSLGYLQGSAEVGGLVASVVFPKNAKKILHVDFYIADSSSGGYSARFKMFDSYPWSAGSRTPIINYWTTYYTGSIVKYICTPSSQTIGPDHVYYLHLTISQTGFLYGVIVYYATVL